MKKSHISVCSALGVIALLVIGAVVTTRIVVVRIASANDGTTAHRANMAPVSHHPDLAGFTRIDAGGTWQVHVTQGPNFDVQLDYPASLNGQIDVRAEDRHLVLEQKHTLFDGFDLNDRQIVATIVMPKLTGIDLSGATQASLTGFSGDQLSIKVSGAAKINGHNGNYKRLQLKVSGAGNVNLTDLPIHNAQVALSGASHVVLCMKGGTLSGTLSGGSHLQYHGTAQEQHIATDGASHVDALD